MIQFKDLKFTTINQAKKDTGLSYLGSINSSAKIVKNAKLNVQTYIIYLAPFKQSGYNVCTFASKECITGCLTASGRAGMDILSGLNIILNSRINKTKLFFENNAYFMDWMNAEITSYQKKAKKVGAIFSARLNGTSDINYLNYLVPGTNKNIFELFSNVQFYDYTKDINKVLSKVPENYHLTFSYSGRNINNCKLAILRGLNIAVVFQTSDFPETFLNLPVINGDYTDYRPMDAKNSIVGLTFKKIANKSDNELIKNSCFVVSTKKLAKVA